MPAIFEAHILGNPQERDHLCGMVERFFMDRPGTWRVSFTGSPANTIWQMSIESPNGRKWSRDLIGEDGEHKPEAVLKYIMEMIEPSDDQLDRLGRIADIKFNLQAGNLYEPAIRETNNLVQQHANAGIASTGRFLRQVADAVEQQFQTLEQLFKGVYIDPFSNTVLSGSQETWLRQKVQTVIDHEVVRAQDITQKLCSCFAGATPKSYSAFVAHLHDAGKKMEQRLNDAITVLILEGETSPERGSGADADRKFARLAIDEARKSVPENDGRPHPLVGAIVVKDGKVVSKAYRGENPKSHAEYIALEGKLSDDLVAGATVYTTLEPCTTRNHPKIPCAQRLVDRKVARVVIGMLDPNPDIRGRGDQLLSDAGIETQLFPRELRAQVEEMNREFIRSQRDRQASAKMPTADEDRSSWPDVILECQWPSLVHESRIPGTHIVRKRPWMLRYGGPGAVYNVRVHKIDLGAYKAWFLPFKVPTLIDTALVRPVICQKSDGLVLETHDLESVVHNPPPGCDVQQYAVEIDGAEDEESEFEDLVLAVEIPVMVSYDDKNGNRFRIKYHLHYDVYSEEGEMIRAGGIEKVVPK